MRGHRKRRIVFVAFDGTQSLDLLGPLEVFDSAGRVVAKGAKNATYEIVVAAASAGSVRTSSGIGLHVDRALASVRGPIDTLVVSGGEGSRVLAKDASFVRTLRRVASRARRVTSVCTGAYLLAAAGLLDGRRATTHWAWCADLARRHPEIRVEPDPIFVRDGNVWTSAGVTAGMDLALALVEDDLGREVALEVARYLVLFVHRQGGQSQFSAQLASQLAEREPLRELQSWIVEHVASDLGVARLAKKAGMSPRNFARTFRRDVGVTPATFVEQVRVEVARRLLETTSMDVPRVAEASGLGTAQTLRQAFARRVGVSPTTYRERFAARGE